MLKRTVNILFCGTGGQGVLSAAEICGWAALLEGFHVKKSEVHGMAQRGGSVESHLRFGARVYSPLIPRGAVDFLVPFHADEQARLKGFLKPGGHDLLAQLEKAQQAVSDRRFVNIYVLGALSVFLPLRQESWMRSIEKVLAGKRLEENKEAFLKGRAAGKIRPEQEGA